MISHVSLLAFKDELEKIALVGAALGGLAGYGMAPRSITGKVIGAGIGMGIGAGIGALGKKSKQWFWDEPRARERAALEDYTPSAVQMSADSPYGPYVY